MPSFHCQPFPAGSGADKHPRAVGAGTGGEWVVNPPLALGRCLQTCYRAVIKILDLALMLTSLWRSCGKIKDVDTYIPLDHCNLLCRYIKNT